MIQCFTKHVYTPLFPPEHEPRLLSISNVHMEYRRRTRALHKHNDRCEILFVYDGNSKYMVGDHLFPVRKGTLIINNSDMLHEDILDEGDTVCHYGISMDGLQLEGLPKNHLIADDVCPIIPAGPDEELLCCLFRTIYDLMTADRPGAEDLCHHLMMTVVTLVLQLVQASDAPRIESGDISSMILEVKQYLNDNYMNNLSLQSVSDRFFISPYHQAHFFKENTGYSLMNFVNRRRIGEAQTLLIKTNNPITEIAGQVGFSNLNSFNIQFQKQVGMSPRQYRKIYLTHGSDSHS